MLTSPGGDTTLYGTDTMLVLDHGAGIDDRVPEHGNRMILYSAYPNPMTNPTTGKIWMDRNLGAAQVATSSTDTLAYGDLCQWGRFADGHQCRTSDTTSTLSSIDTRHKGSRNCI